MKLTKVQKLILYALGQFYHSLDQSLSTKILKVQTSKITFIELLIKSTVLVKQERAIYKNLETLENRKLIIYENHLIRLTDNGIKELQKINKEISQYNDIKNYFINVEKPKRKLQTTLKNN